MTFFDGRPVFQSASRLALAAVCAAALMLPAGCGYIAEQDRIVVATMDGKELTRGDLRELIRAMPDEERPLIQNKGDLQRTLNEYIDGKIKAEVAKKLSAEGKIEVSRDAARARYLQTHPEYAAAYQVRDPEQLGMTQGDIDAVKAAVEFGVDDEVDKMLAEEAVAYLMHQAMESGSVKMTIEDVQREYEMRRQWLIQFEYIEFTAMVFPVDMPGAIEQAADAYRKIQAAEAAGTPREQAFDHVLAELVARSPSYRMYSAAQNDPASERFRVFWQTAHGAKVGGIYGPVILPAHEELGPGPDGKPVARRVPAAHIVFKVTKYEPERIKTFDEAKNEVATMMLRRAVMQQLRDQHGVEVYPDKLWDPAGFGDQYKDLMIDTGQPAAGR